MQLGAHAASFKVFPPFPDFFSDQKNYLFPLMKTDWQSHHQLVHRQSCFCVFCTFSLLLLPGEIAFSAALFCVILASSCPENFSAVWTDSSLEGYATIGQQRLEATQVSGLRAQLRTRPLTVQAIEMTRLVRLPGYRTGRTVSGKMSAMHLIQSVPSSSA